MLPRLTIDLHTEDGRTWEFGLKGVDPNGQIVEAGVQEVKDGEAGGPIYVLTLPIVRVEKA
ncbi:MAG: hypothetical protein DLM66_00275 [Candidatus Dormiibacter spiritus]|nr:MAG: hypothetical protein DLM66_00275 [Candidatus Dormibacteraeota bacterium]